MIRVLFLSTALVTLTAANPEGMVQIPGGTFTRGSNLSHFPEENPAHEVTVSSFLIDQHEVTNAQFEKFVKATNYRTQAERGWSAKDFPQAPPETLKPGAMVFSAPPEKVRTSSPGAHWQWWRFIPGANWRHPLGPDSDLKGKANHPVVCVTYEDALAYAQWAKKRLPTEAEWERAARGNHRAALFVWGSEPKPDAKSWPANIFTGEFPHNDTAQDGFAGTAPVKSFPSNDFGLYDMAGNVWEICADYYRPDAYPSFLKKPLKNPTGPMTGVTEPMANYFMARGQYPTPDAFGKPHRLALLRVTKGGSYLCHHSYCLRYRPAARHHAESLAPTNHTGFRCARSLD